ncbi:MAG: hypothetical protein ACRYF0_18425 [Janthinobacterium lividum]
MAILLGCQGQAPHLSPHEKIFVRGRKFIYAATHFAPDGRLLSRDTVAITCLGKYKPGQYDTTQLKLGYSYNATSAPSSFPGVLENDSTLWIHPPRDGQYSILELSPFPFIKLPARQGKRWRWELAVGSHWGNPAWATWRGDMLVTSIYHVAGRQLVATPLGELPCWVVQAEATCKKGTAALTSFYNPRYGFVRLTYRNLNNRRVTLSLVAVATVDTSQPDDFLPESFQALGPVPQP